MADPETRPWATRLLQLVTGVRFVVIAAVVVILALAYTLAGFFLAPRLIASYVPRYAQEQLQRRAEIGEVRVNPLLFKLEIKDFRLQEPDGRPLLSFDRLFVDFQLSSLFRWAWTFAEIQLEGPRLDVSLAPDGRLNLAELAPQMEQLYPRHLWLNDIQGHVEIQLVVDVEGRVEKDQMKVVSATNPDFEAATRALVRLMRWEPARRNGRPVRVWVLLPVNWTMGG